MDYYKKKVVKNILLAILFSIGLLLQVYGHQRIGKSGLAIQLLSIAVLLIVLFLYNQRHNS